MKKVVLFLLMTAALFADDWELELNANLTTTLSQYSENWAGEERGSFTWTTTWLMNANKQLVDRVRMENKAKFAFGQTAFEKRDSLNKRDGWDTLAITTDEIDIQNMELLTFGWPIDPYIAFRAEGSFDNQTEANKNVKYLNPWLLTQSLGGRAQLLKDIDEQDLKIRFGAAIKENWERKDTTLVDGGLELVTDYEAKINGNLSYKTTLELYEALFVSDDRENDDWRMVDIKWDNDLVASVTKYVMVTYTLGLYYDKEIDEDVRLKQALSAGFSFGWNNKN